jgi:purine-binding chemotaxis protein CheW
MQVVTFRLGDECYGLPIETIQEIIMDREYTRVPNLPPFLKGIIHLREVVIPIVEGAERLGYDEDDIPEPGDGRILIVEYDEHLIGVRVSDAENVLTIDADDVQSSPDMISDLGGRFVQGVVELDGEDSHDSSDFGSRRSARENIEETSASQEIDESVTILLLDLDELFTGEEIQQISQAKKEHGDEIS